MVVQRVDPAAERVCTHHVWILVWVRDADVRELDVEVLQGRRQCRTSPGEMHTTNTTATPHH